MKKNVVFIAFAVYGLLLFVLSYFALPFCKSGADMIMNCEKSSLVEAILGLSIFVVSFLGVFIKQKKILIAVSIFLSLLGVFIILVPTLIVGVCSNPHMLCHSVSLPILIFLGALLTFVGLFYSFYLIKFHE